jgi:hypothetical protein
MLVQRLVTAGRGGKQIDIAYIERLKPSFRQQENRRKRILVTGSSG